MSSQGPAAIPAPLRDVMHTRRLSTRELSIRTGISDTLIHRYRSGTVIPRDYYGDPTANARRIAAELGVDVDDLFPQRPLAA